MLHQGEEGQAENFLSEVLREHPDNIDVQLYHFQWIIEKGNAQTLSSLIPEILSSFSKAEQKRLILSVAASLQQSGITALAINILTAHMPENDTMDYRYMRALLAADMGDIVLAEADLRFILAKDPEHIDALNALGYTLADANKNLQEAQVLIERAYAKDANSSAIVDSMGWVLYRLGKLPEALEYIQQAFEIDPSAEIAAHLGEILWNLNKKDSAIKVLSSAITESPDSKAVKNIIHKLNIQLETNSPKP